MRLLAFLVANRVLFQSAPLTDVRGDSWISRNIKPISKFQSAPLTDVRGDLLVTRSYRPQGRFQSAPLTDVRGDSISFRATLGQPNVSIRSPHGCKGRCGKAMRERRQTMFQSAPLTDVRGD